MSEVRQALTGILAALISAIIVLGSIVLALSETGQKLARLPESSAELSTPMPPPPTSKPGEPTYTAVPTRLPQTATSADTFNCPLPPGWERKEASPDDTWESLALQSGVSLEELLEANCLEPGDFRNSKLGYGYLHRPAEAHIHSRHHAGAHRHGDSHCHAHPGYPAADQSQVGAEQAESHHLQRSPGGVGAVHRATGRHALQDRSADGRQLGDAAQRQLPALPA